MSESNENQKLTDLERLLASLPPRQPSIDRDRLLFRAGQVSVAGRGWGWPLATLFMTVVSCALGLFLVYRPVHYVPAYAKEPAPAKPSLAIQAPPEMTIPEVFSSPAPEYHEDSYSPGYSNYNMRQQALRFGAESLPTPIGDLDALPATPPHEPMSAAMSLDLKKLPSSLSALLFGER